MARKFDNIDDLKRDRSIEGDVGIDIKLKDGLFLTVLAASDANPAWKAKGSKALKEIDRQRNAGAPESVLNRMLATLYAETLIKGWHGGQDEAGNNIPGGPTENGVIVPFGRQNCIDFLCEADDAMSAVITTCIELKNFRIARAEQVVDQAGN